MSVTFCNTDILAHSRIASELLQPQPQTGSCPLNTFRTKMFYLWQNAGFTYSRAREAKTSGWFQTQRSNLCHGEWTYAGRWWIWNWGWPSEPAVRRSQEPRGSHYGSSQACQDGGSWRSQHPFLVSQSDCYHRIQNQVEDCNHCFSPSVLPVKCSVWMLEFSFSSISTPWESHSSLSPNQAPFHSQQLPWQSLWRSFGASTCTCFICFFSSI